MSFLQNELSRAFSRPQQQRILGLGPEWGFIFADFKDHQPNPESIKLATFSNFACNWVLEGRGSFITESGVSYPLGPGSVFQRLPGTQHSTILDETRPYREFYLCCDPQTYKSLRQLRLIRLHSVLDVGADDLICERCLRFHQRLSDRQVRREQVLLEMIDILQAFYQRADARRSDAFWGSKIQQAKAILSQPESSHLPLEEIAERVGATYPSFRRAFREETGMAPGEYRIRKRLEHACLLLATQPVKAVAEELQYSDPFTFSTQFKKFVGISPSQFQQTLKKRA